MDCYTPEAIEVLPFEATESVFVACGAMREDYFGEILS